jgi:hypothetical protein
MANKKKKLRGRPKKDETLELISFRLLPEQIEKLQKLAQKETDDLGQPLSKSAMARRLLVAALKN